MMVFLPEHKMAHVLSLLEEFISALRRTVREVSSMVGKLVSLEPALGTEILVSTRLALIEVVAFSEAYCWDYSFLLSDDTVVALREAGTLLRFWNGHPILTCHTAVSLAGLLPAEAEMSLERKIPIGLFCHLRATLASNASASAVAAFCVDGVPYFELISKLSSEEQVWSSSRSEWLALQRVLDEQGASLLSSFLTDNSFVAIFCLRAVGSWLSCFRFCVFFILPTVFLWICILFDFLAIIRCLES
jgi:hypothetical protein